MDKIDIIKRCLDNTAPIERYEDLGILFFARHFFENCQSHRQGEIHYYMMMNALSLLNPKYKNRMERQLYIKIFREGAKSTHFSFVLPLFLTNLVGGTMHLRVDNEGYAGADVHNYDIVPITLTPEFILILSETHASAERFTMNIRYELESNRQLKSVFGSKMPQNVADEGTGLWRKDSFMTPDKMIIFGQGAGQQVRGMLPFGARPTLAIFDDIYSRKNTLTEETREKLRYWFFAEAINSIDTMKGKALLVGTMVHEDTVFTDIAKSTQWKGITYPVISKDELEECLTYCRYDTNTRNFELPSKDNLKMLQANLKSLAWRDRQNIEFILSAYKEKFEINKTSYYYQEYLHILSSPEDEAYKDHQVHFTDIIVERENYATWVEFEWDTYRWKGKFTPCIGIDVASSERESSDDTAILIGGWCHVYPILEGFDAESAQKLHPHKHKGLKLPILVDGYMGKCDVYDDDVIGKRGIVNIVYDFCKKYNVKNITIETNAQQGLVFREIKKFLRTNHISAMVHGENTVMAKEDAINSVLMPVVQGHKKIIMQRNTMFYNIWSQLKHLGVAKHDDGADAMKALYLHSEVVKQPEDFQAVPSIKRIQKAKPNYVMDWKVY